MHDRGKRLDEKLLLLTHLPLISGPLTAHCSRFLVMAPSAMMFKVFQCIMPPMTINSLPGAQEYYVKEIRLPSPEALQHRELPRFVKGPQGVSPGFGQPYAQRRWPAVC